MLYKIINDTEEYYVSKSTLEKYPKFTITQHLSHSKIQPDMHCINKTLYIDADSESFNYLIKFIRGMQINYNIITKTVINNIKHTAKKFGLFEMLNNIDKPDIIKTGPSATTFNFTDGQLRDAMTWG